MMKKRVILLSMMCAALTVSACSDSSSNTDETVNPDPKPTETGNLIISIPTERMDVSIDASLNSTLGCTLDSDCIDGAFCFHSRCVSQCSANNDTCGTGFKCSSRGRCIKGSKTRDLTADDDLAESKVTSVKDVIPGVEIIRSVDDSVYVDPAQTKVEVSIQTAQDYGTIHYVALAESDEAVGTVLPAEPIENPDKTYSYSFSVTPQSANLGEKDGKPEVVILDTSAGQFKIVMTPRPTPSGLYSGLVTAPQFGGTTLGIRMGLKVQPAQPQSFDEITAIDIYLPASEDDLFSPVPAKADAASWNHVKMVKTNSPSECASGTACWVAKFSANNFTMPDSKVLTKDQQVNRAIRVEISDFSSDKMRFVGTVRDVWTGLYRTTDGSIQNWSSPSLSGNLNISRTDAFDTDALADAVVDHTPDSIVIRDIKEKSSVGTPMCTEEVFAKLMQSLPTDDSHAACKTYTLENEFTTPDKFSLCVTDAAQKIADNKDTLVSSIIERLLTKGDSTDNIAGFSSLAEFMENCKEADGVCKERPEVVCAVDLLARSLISSDTISAEQMENWISLMRESYLGKQFSAWQIDTDVRLEWLQNATSPSFLVSILENINEKMLTKWETEVLNSHRSVMSRQFSQASLELLSRATENTKIINLRSLILSDFSSAWQEAAGAAALSGRRYNTLYQDYEKRLKKATMLSRNLFDLYYVGLVESAMNIRAGETALNATFASNIASIVSMIKSLKLTFEDLVYMRDAEIVVSTSLNPESSAYTVLSERKKLAVDTIEKAQTMYKTVLKENEEKNIKQAESGNLVQNNLDKLMTEIVSICGKPKDCDGAAGSSEKCMPLTEPLQCGFNLSHDSTKFGSLAPINITEETQLYLKKDQCPGDSSKTEPKKCGCRFDEVYEDEEETILSGCVIDSTNVVAASNNQNAIYDFIDTMATGIAASQAGDAVYEYQLAMKNFDIARADYQALYNKVQNSRAVTEQYAQNLEEWHKGRNELIQKVMDNVNAINAHLDNITDAERANLTANANSLKAAYDKQKANLDDWDKISSKFVSGNKDDISNIRDLTIAANFTHVVSDFGMNVADALSTSNDATAIIGNHNLVGGIIKLSASTISLGLDLAAASMDSRISVLEARTQKAELDYNYQTELNDRKTELDIANLEKELSANMALYQKVNNVKTIEECQENLKNLSQSDSGIAINHDAVKCVSEKTCTCDKEAVDTNSYDLYHGDNCPSTCTLTEEFYYAGIEQYILSEQNAADTIDQVNDYMRELFEVQDLYNRDLQSLAEKRVEYLNQAEDLIAKQEQISKAYIAVLQAQNRYFTIVQRAQQLQASYDSAKARRDKIANLYSTPYAIFSFASDLDIVESMLESARDRIYDYLSAIEYLAVRPFVDLRRATYIARSPNDLTAIVEKAKTIESACGGNVNNNSVELSVRELMGITTDFVDMTKEQRFHYTMAKRNMPVDTITRYTVDSTVKDLLASGKDLRAGTFEITIKDFGNLATTCNAKIDAIQIQLVGENLIKEGTGENIHPTMSLFYNGQAQLASCQSNIKDIVATLNGRSAYGPYTTFSIQDIKISPTAGINSYGNDTNISLAGYPLAATYTVLIDTEISENKNINWNNVTDIKLKVSYNYQDMQNNSKCTDK